jgi:hypothetical protein
LSESLLAGSISDIEASQLESIVYQGDELFIYLHEFQNLC